MDDRTARMEMGRGLSTSGQVASPLVQFPIDRTVGSLRTLGTRVVFYQFLRHNFITA